MEYAAAWGLRRDRMVVGHHRGRALRFPRSRGQESGPAVVDGRPPCTTYRLLDVGRPPVGDARLVIETATSAQNRARPGLAIAAATTVGVLRALIRLAHGAIVHPSRLGSCSVELGRWT